MSALAQPVPAQLSEEELRAKAERRDTQVLVWLIVALGAFLRLRGLQAKSFWLDEVASVVIARMPGNSFWNWLWTEEGNMALYYVLLRQWMQIHLGEATIRLLSVLPGVAAIPVMYLLGRRLFGRGTGLLAALFLALSTCAVVYAQEARGYSWLLLGTIVSTYFFARLIAKPTHGMALAYALAAGITCYFHYFGLLVPAAHAVALFALPKERRPWAQLIPAGVLIAFFATPVLWMIHMQPGRHLDWVPKPSLLELYHIGVFLAAESGKGVGPVLLVIELALVVVFFRALLAARREKRADFFAYVLVASSLLSPMAIALLASASRPVFFHRFLIICLPAWLLAAAVGCTALAQAKWKVAAIVGVCLLSVIATASSYSRMREDWRGVVNLLIDHANSQDVVLYYRGVGHFAAESYRDWMPGGGSNRPLAVEVGAPGVDWHARMGNARRVWLVEYPANVNDDTSRAVEAELHRRYSAAASFPFRAITVTEFVPKP